MCECWNVQPKSWCDCMKGDSCVWLGVCECERVCGGMHTRVYASVCTSVSSACHGSAPGNERAKGDSRMKMSRVMGGRATARMGSCVCPSERACVRTCVGECVAPRQWAPAHAVPG